MENIAIGLQLMLIGMVTVFVILLIVIYGSKLLISLINRVSIEDVKAEPKSTQAAPVALLEAAVAQITGGTGHIVSITEIR